MNKMRLMLNTLAVFGVCLLCSSLAQAQATRTWVSGVGDDVNPCSRTAPCKTFAGAISKTAAGGEISALDPGGFGAVTITKSITINGDGTLAGILASLVNGIIVNAGAADKVIIRNVSLQGAGNGINGIRFLAGGQLSVENCTIIGFTGFGIEVNKTASANVYVKDTNITKVATGISFTTSGGNIVAHLDNVRIEGNGNGVLVATNSFANITRSSIFQNATNGIQVSAAGSVANVESTVVSHNGTGLNASVSSANIRISNVTVFNNGTGINAAGGSTVLGFFNNRIAGNGTNGAPTAQQAQQ
jgi:parallel beta helix pectate lyase-like protein